MKKEESINIKRTFKLSSLSKEQEAGATENAEAKNSSEFFNHDLAVDTAFWTSSSEGRTTNMSCEALKDLNSMIIRQKEVSYGTQTVKRNKEALQNKKIRK